jgi:valyl-tRNA synthetase
LYRVLLTLDTLFAPFLPYITEAVYQGLFAEAEGSISIHRSRWPQADETLLDEQAEAAGGALIEIATAVRRYKSEGNLALNTALSRLQLAVADAGLAAALREATDDLASITRAAQIEVCQQLGAGLEEVKTGGAVALALAR